MAHVSGDSVHNKKVSKQKHHDEGVWHTKLFSSWWPECWAGEEDQKGMGKGPDRDLKATSLWLTQVYPCVPPIPWVISKPMKLTKINLTMKIGNKRIEEMARKCEQEFLQERKESTLYFSRRNKRWNNDKNHENVYIPSNIALNICIYLCTCLYIKI